MKFKSKIVIYTGLAIAAGSLIQTVPVMAQVGKQLPARLAAPTITSPQNNARVKSPITLKGKATRGAEVNISVKTTYDGGETTAKKYKFAAKNNTKGQWEYAGIALETPAGKKNIKYIVSVTQNTGRIASAAKTITLLPQAQIIGELKPPIKLDPKDNPKPPSANPPRKVDPDVQHDIDEAAEQARRKAPTITSPAQNAPVNGAFEVKGTASSGDKVSVSIKTVWKEGNSTKTHNSSAVTVNADNQGNWKTGRIPAPAPNYAQNAYDIQQTISAKRVYSDGTTSSTATRNVRGHILAVPTITSTSDTDTALNQKMTIKGTGIPGWRVGITVKEVWGKYVKRDFTGPTGSLDVGGYLATVKSDGTWQITTDVFPKPPTTRRNRTEYGPLYLGAEITYKYISPAGDQGSPQKKVVDTVSFFPLRQMGGSAAG